MNNKKIQANIPDEAGVKEPGFVETPWVSWNVQFHRLLSLEEIPYEIPQLENCLTDYLIPFTRKTRRKIKIKFSLKYTWNQFGKNKRSYVLWVFLRPHPAAANTPEAPAESVIIVKDDGRYIVDTDKHKKRSTKNTVKLTPPAV